MNVIDVRVTHVYPTSCSDAGTTKFDIEVVYTSGHTMTIALSPQQGLILQKQLTRELIRREIDVDTLETR